MDRDIVIGMSSTFLLWSAVLLWASARLVCLNIGLYRNWLSIERDVRVKMALWLAVPLFMAGLLWMRGVVFTGHLLGHYASSFGVTQAIGFMFVVLFALSLSLWWACDRSYAPKYGTAYADLIWCRVMWLGVGIGISVTFLSWWY